MISTDGLTRTREMAVGNTFGATALSSYGGFWISFAIILTPGGFDIVDSIVTADGASGFTNSFGLYLFVRLTSSASSPLYD
jgi:succinate-acetate transporter protein